MAAAPGSGGARVFVVREPDRAKAVAACLDAAAFTACQGRDVAIKANFNSADPFPASTHPATLAALLASLTSHRAASLTLGERSGMGDTRRVLEATGVADVLASSGARMVVLDELGRDGWRPFRGEHWPQGFLAAQLFAEAPCVVQTMCCKTHRFGGHVTLALKNTVGLVAKYLPGAPHNYMRDLHGSEHQRAMIAEANLAWRPALNIMDCLEAFVDGGPEQGTRAAPGVFLASDDRCALDAAAIALLRLHGMKGPAARGPIGRTAQLARALEVGLGAAPRAVTVVPVTSAAREAAGRIAELLAEG
ncbi:MAG: hypothetical protein AUH29_11400 [Candidatus Rokubacteria bacterium 13_1_40CM_69_27]|nr:MAG: hypothetical protein AUH29_11400 [Candidatus Rokubacteria bacterium 13_1_40CM_69_27]OLC35435.1 MAG: hypothetical protein AUH81_10210 [Candidatus Rokubacteria bacterium 13_1_40CM_4_69_5]